MRRIFGIASAQAAREGLDIVDQQLRLFQRTKVTAAWHFAPAMDIVNVDAIDVGDELRESVYIRFLLAPVEFVYPVIGDSLM